MVRGPLHSADPPGVGWDGDPRAPLGAGAPARAGQGRRSPEPRGRLPFPAGGIGALHGARADTRKESCRYGNAAGPEVAPGQRSSCVMPPPPPSEQALDVLLARKEEEWRALQAQRSQLQEAALREAQARLRRLQEDFVYNLQVLEERDRELERYDAAFAQARGLEEARQAEASELRVEAAKLRQALTREAQRLEDLQQRYRQKLQEHRLELERVRSDQGSEIDRQREQYEKLTWKLERKLEELDGELALQRQELLLEFESELQKRERELRLQADSASSAVLTHELQVQQLSRELAAVREAGAQAAESLRSAEAASSELRDKLQRSARELGDLTAVKDARIRDLEGQLHCVQLTWRKEEETFRRKHEELDRLARERDVALAAVKDAHAEQLQALEAQVRGLQAHCEALELQLRKAEWRRADSAREQDAATDRLREEASALRSAWDAQVAQLSKEATAKDLQVQSLQEEEAKLKAQLARCQQDVVRYRRQLSLAVEREQSLEREKVQLGLDWQRRCDHVERDRYQQSEELVRGLATAKEQVAAKLQETERKLRDQEVVLKAVTLERDRAMQALSTRGPLPETDAQLLLRSHEGETSESFPSSEIQRLQDQNASLRNVVAQMRTEMEALSDHVHPSAHVGGETTSPRQPEAQAAADAATPDYVLALEAEIRTLKHKFQTLEEQLGGVLEPLPAEARPPADARPPAQAASDAAAGGAVLADGVATGFALRRLGDRARLLNFLVARLKQKVWSPDTQNVQVLQGPLDVDTVRRELPHELDQVHLEVLELRKQVAELEKHFVSAGKEGGAHPSQQQPWVLDAMALGREGLADGAAAAGPEAQEVRRLRRRLQAAARSIVRLRLEKEQLQELGNRLRAQRGRAGTPRCPHPGPEAQSPGGGPQAPVDLGPPLQQLQPHVATQRQPKIPTATDRSPRQKENQSPKPHQAPECHQDRDCHTQRSPSLASSSLQDTWKLLDLGSSPSGPTSQDDSTAVGPKVPPAAHGLPHPDGSPIQKLVAFAIEGTKMDMQAKAKAARPSRVHPAKPRCSRQPPKVRNYNCKE
ncbi:coiled-coil domain-containing protein 57 isoform X4 [Rousettus aegyptiacus]|uniref:coiled-coil domain-containing protein 57 isoform X4 n=1 Tax=Rousettus aegyptiacus TaxID=9407 RepID=UPI00168D713D|nr:coiled-coil domain-containing protein 57 isoform X4 [Rousettus aegyptiacus]